MGSGSSITALPVVNGAKFSGSRMSHAGITNNCVACHTASGSTAAFAGITSIVRMPPTSPMGVGSHIPSSTTCESCHLGTLANVSGLVPANATRTAPGTLFATPAPTTAQIHAGVTSGCNSCHEANYVWMGMSAYPIAPAVKTNGAQYTGFHTRPRAAAGTFNVADASHPITGDCSQCHSGTNYFSAQDKPANHIPYAATAQCTACHTGTDYSIKPTLTAIHANAPSTTTNCAQCHGAAAASFAIPASNFSIVGLPTNHIPTSASCEVCHVGTGSSITALPVVNGAKFSGSRMSHTGITNNCVACHTAVGQHGQLRRHHEHRAHAADLADGGGFAHPVEHDLRELPPRDPGQRQRPGAGECHTHGTGHAVRDAGADHRADPRRCHQRLQQLPRGELRVDGHERLPDRADDARPTARSTPASRPGRARRPAPSTWPTLRTRPRATAASATAARTTSAAQDKPANHIPYAAAAQCTACHTSTDYSVMPTLTAIHANAQSTTTNCAQCHGAAAPSFAIPAANFSIVGLPSNHIPTSASCEVCHVGTGSSITALPVVNGAKFSGSRMSHTGITNNCVACHTASGSTASFAGITNIVRMPPTSPMGAGSHIPSSTTCESCHLGTLANVSGLVPANATRTAPGTLFATPAPTTAQIHAGVTSGCNSCHEAGYVWMGMSAYPIAPTTLVAGAQYTGFHTRPRAAASTFSVADAAHPATGDCSQCHSGTNYFSAQAKPAGHIPTNGACATCHVTPGDYSIAGLTTNKTTMHTGISSGCASCHTAGAGAGPFAGCATQAACANPPPLTYQPKVMPLAAGGSPDRRRHRRRTCRSARRPARSATRRPCSPRSPA